MSNYEVEMTINNRVVYYKEFRDVQEALERYYSFLYFVQQLDAPVELELYSWHDDAVGSVCINRYTNIDDRRN